MQMTRFTTTGLRTIVMLLLTGAFAVGLVAGGARPAQAGSGAFNLTGSMNVARMGQTATLLQNGKVLVTGGENFTTGFLASAELYDPAQGKWTLTGSMSVARNADDAVLLQNGAVLVAGGFNGSTPGSCSNLASAELYNPATGTWTATGSMTAARSSFALIGLPNGEVLAAGGSSCTSYLPLTSAELYNPATGTWTATGNMPSGTANDGAVLLKNGDVLVDGVNLYNPSTGTWTAVTSPTNAGGLLLPNGDVWTNTTLQGGFIYDPATNQSIAYPPPSCMTTTQTCNGGVALLSTGKVLIAGGITKVNAQPYPIEETNGNAAVFDPATLTWTSTGSMKKGRIGETVTILPNGQPLFAGGEAYDKSVGALRPIASAELYTP